MSSICMGSKLLVQLLGCLDNPCRLPGKSVTVVSDGNRLVKVNDVLH